MQIAVSKSAELPGQTEGSLHNLTDEIAYQRLAIVNVVLSGVREAGDRHWVLVDAGIGGTAALIADAAERRFGKGARPAAILLTHGHFDHVGALATLAERWDAPIYAHELELPFLDGTRSYPPPDPSVGGGLMSMLSPLYPRGPIDVHERLLKMPPNEVPGMPGWQVLSTSGHSPGHISFWNPTDRILIAGDAFITTRQESAFAVLTQAPEIHGPPMYYTPDWESARRSLEGLAALEPETVISGHGPAMHGSEMREALHRLAREFDEIARPKQGRYVLDAQED